MGTVNGLPTFTPNPNANYTQLASQMLLLSLINHHYKTLVNDLQNINKAISYSSKTSAFKKSCTILNQVQTESWHVLARQV